VVREDQVDGTAVQVVLRAERRLGYRGVLDVPPRPARPQRGVPVWLAGLAPGLLVLEPGRDRTVPLIDPRHRRWLHGMLSQPRHTRSECSPDGSRPATARSMRRAAANTFRC
jgi:hypothetical protein